MAGGAPDSARPARALLRCRDRWVRLVPMFVELLRAQARAHPASVALVVDGSKPLTYADWDRRGEALGAGLVARGVEPGDRVALCLGPSAWIDHAVAYAGVHRAGAVPVLVGPGTSPGAMAADHGVTAVVCPPGRPGKVGPPDSIWSGSTGELEDGGPLGTADPIRLSNLAHLQAVGGPLAPWSTTEEPAQEFHRLARELSDTPPRPYLHAFSPASAAGARALWLAVTGPPAPVVSLAEFDPHALCEATIGHGGARWGLAPATAAWLLDSGALAQLGSDMVGHILVEGAVSPALFARLAEALPSAVLACLAPSSEGAGELSVSHPGRSDEPRRRLPSRPSAPSRAVDVDGEDIPVTASQEGMLWHEQFAPGSQNLPPLVRRYHGPLDAAALEQALAEIVRRHEPLRTTFELRDGRPVQVVAATGAALDVRDLGALDAEARDAEVAELLVTLRRPFDLVAGPLFAPYLVRLAPEDHLVVLRVHHSVFDDWSVSVFRRELSVLYGAFLAGEPSPLGELPLSYSDFARGQHRRLAGPAGSTELAWWKDHLAGAPWSLQLPIEDPDLPAGAPQPSAEPVSVVLSDTLSAQLRALARRQRTTVFMTMLAAFEVLVHRYTGQRELLAASVVAHRNRPELEGMIGCFTKKVLVRLDGGGDPSFVDLLPRVRTSLLGSLAHQDLPFETVLQQSLGPAAAAHGLVPQVAVMFQGVTPQGEEVVLPGVTSAGFDTSATTTRTHFAARDTGERAVAGGEPPPWGAGLYGGTFLILSVIEGHDGLSLAARGAFHRPSVVTLLANFETLLGDIVAQPTRRISELHLTPEDDPEDDDAGASGPAWPEARATGAHHRVDQAVVGWAVRSPARPALGHGSLTLDYAQVNARAQDLADRLRSSDLGPGRVVGLCVEDSVAAVVGALGVWRAGAAFLALDPAATIDHLAGALRASSASVVLSDCLPAGEDFAGMASVLPVHPGPAFPIPGAGQSSASIGPGPAVILAGTPGGAAPAVTLDHDRLGVLGRGLAELFGPSPLAVALTAAPTDPTFLRQLLALVGGHCLTVVDRGRQTWTGEVVAGLRSGQLDVVDVRAGDLFDLLDAGLAQALAQRPVGAPLPVVMVGAEQVVDPETAFRLKGLSGARILHLWDGSPQGSAVVAGGVSAVGRPTVEATLTGEALAVLDRAGRPSPEQVVDQLHQRPPGLSGPWRPTGLLARRLPGERIELVGSSAATFDLRGFRVDALALTDVLHRCRGMEGVELRARPEPDGDPEFVAEVGAVPPGIRPNRSEVQAALWRRLPGSAVPASVEVAGSPGPSDSSSPPARLVGQVWAESSGREEIDPEEIYWQSFSFLEAVARARQIGMYLGDEDIVRNRTIANLAASWRARCGQLPTDGEE